MASFELNRLMVIGAHPDDCEGVGGLVSKLLDRGVEVRFLSVTNGSGGHHETPGAALVKRREMEAQMVARVFSLSYQILDNEDGRLGVSLPEREGLLKEIRLFDPDIIITHRPLDYHPDHRNTSQLVQDCAYLLQVPAICPLTPAMSRMPAIFYMQDAFLRPYPFTPDLVFDITKEADTKLLMYHFHTSQMYEWLPYVGGMDLSQIPKDEEGRLSWLRTTAFFTRGQFYAQRFKAAWEQKYGAPPSQNNHAEALEICSYGRELTQEELQSAFPF